MGQRKKHHGRHEVSDDDKALFREAIGPVDRLPQSRPGPRKQPPPPRAHMFERDEASVRDELLTDFDPTVMETGAELSWLRDGYSPKLLRKLKRGHFSIDDELDLHHTSAQAARSLLRGFLDEATAEDMGCVRIIHGKGLRSGPRGPVLKGLTDHLLRHHRSVLAFASAPRTEGGTGAVLVLLRRD